MAAATAVSGLAKIVREPGPCRPSKFRLDVETQYSPAGILSSFIAKHAEHPGCRISNPASSKIVPKPSSCICFATCCEPGTISALTFFAFFFPLQQFGSFYGQWGNLFTWFAIGFALAQYQGWRKIS